MKKNKLKELLKDISVITRLSPKELGENLQKELEKYKKIKLEKNR